MSVIVPGSSGTRLGSSRTARHLGPHGVDVDAIPVLCPPFKVLPYEQAAFTGRAPKDFVVIPSDRRFGHAYIAKKPCRDHTGARECVTEYLISRIGQFLPLRVARGRPARLPSSEGQDVRFMSRYFLEAGREHLRRGVELFATVFEVGHETLHREVGTDDQERIFYTVDMVDAVLEAVARGPENHARLRDAFARMLTFDALVGSQDRHVQNWGVIEDVMGQHPPRFAPVFDTARGLFLRIDEEQPDPGSELDGSVIGSAEGG